MGRDSVAGSGDISNDRSAMERYRYLSALVDRKDVPSAIVEMCRSQSRLAAWNVPERNISPMSLNTLKAAADREIEDGGWANLNALRLQIARTPRQRSVSRVDAQSSEIKRLRTRLDESARARAVLNRAYFDALTLLQASAARDEVLAAQLERHNATYQEVFGLRIVTGGRDG